MPQTGQLRTFMNELLRLLIDICGPFDHAIRLKPNAAPLAPSIRTQLPRLYLHPELPHSHLGPAPVRISLTVFSALSFW